MWFSSNLCAHPKIGGEEGRSWKHPPAQHPPIQNLPPRPQHFAYQLLCTGWTRMFGAKIFLNIYLTAILPIFLADESTIWTTSLMESTSQPTQPTQPSQTSQTSQPGQTTETSEPRMTRRYQLESSSLPTYIIYQVFNQVDKSEKAELHFHKTKIIAWFPGALQLNPPKHRRDVNN